MFAGMGIVYISASRHVYIFLLFNAFRDIEAERYSQPGSV
jgi:hypothetical protein